MAQKNNKNENLSLESILSNCRVEHLVEITQYEDKGKQKWEN